MISPPANVGKLFQVVGAAHEEVEGPRVEVRGTVALRVGPIRQMQVECRQTFGSLQRVEAEGQVVSLWLWRLLFGFASVFLYFSNSSRTGRQQFGKSEKRLCTYPQSLKQNKQ